MATGNRTTARSTSPSIDSASAARDPSMPWNACSYSEIKCAHDGVTTYCWQGRLEMAAG
jgi:hypothetical protein